MLNKYRLSFGNFIKKKIEVVLHLFAKRKSFFYTLINYVKYFLKKLV